MFTPDEGSNPGLLTASRKRYRLSYAHFISDQIQGFDINMLFWKGVDRLQMNPPLFQAEW